MGTKGDVFYFEPGQPPPVSRAQPASTQPAQLSSQKHGLKSKVKTFVTANKKSDSSEDKTPRRNVRNGLRQNGHSPSVTFNDRPTGLLKHVRLFVDPGKHNLGRRASLCERLFGIVPGHFSTRPVRDDDDGGGGGGDDVRDNRIMVQALLPGREAVQCADIKIGEA